jgi:hypothetical protein
MTVDKLEQLKRMERVGLAITEMLVAEGYEFTEESVFEEGERLYVSRDGVVVAVVTVDLPPATS